MQESNSKFGNLPQGLLSFGGTVVLTSLIVTAAIVGLRELSTLEGLELGAYDVLMRSRPDKGIDKRIVVVGINDEDIQTRKEYPIHDGTLAKTLEKLEEKGARIIGIDILRDVPQGPATGRKELIKRLSESDRIIAVCELSKPDSPGTPTAPGIPDDRIGVADYQPDPGGIVRRGMLIATPGKPNKKPSVEHICNKPDPKTQLPSLSFQMVLGYLAEVQPEGQKSKKAPDPQTEDAENTDGNNPEPHGIQAETTKSGEIKLGDVVLKRLQKKAGGYRHLLEGGYEILLNYRSSNNAVKVVSLLDVLNDKVSEADIKDKVVLMGYTAAVVHDTFYTPFSAGAADNQKMPGVVVHAQNASQIISAVLDKQPLMWYWQDWQENTWIFGWTVLGAILAWRIRNPWLLVLGSGVAIIILSGTAYYLFIQALWIPLVPPLLGLLLSATSVVLIDRYAATIVKTVKGFLKINVEIDHQKKEEEVAAIVESDYFLELQQKAKNLRGKEKADDITPTTKEDTPRTIPPLVSNIEEALPLRPSMTTKIEETVIDTPAITRPTSTRRTANTEAMASISPISPMQSQQSIEDVDYLQQVYERRRQQNTPVNLTETASENQPLSAENINEEQENTAYLKQLRMRSKGLKEGRK